MPLEKTLKKFRNLKLGKLRRLISFTDEPHFYQYSCSRSKNSSDEESEGTATGINEEETKVRAFGECIERYGLQKIPSNLIVDSFNNLNSDAINPENFVNFRNQDIGGKKSEYIEKLKKAKISWVIGKDLQHDKDVLIPAQLVYVPFNKEEPLIRSQISTGAAAHENYEDAIIKGIFEVIERDSFMLRYLSRDDVPEVKLDNSLEELKNYFNRYYLELKILDITTDLGVPSFMCLNLDYTGGGPAVSVGLSSGSLPREVILKSILESQQARQWARLSYIQDKKPIIKNSSEIHSIKDRCYYWYLPTRIKDLNFLQNGHLENIDEIPPLNLSLKDLINHLHNKKVSSYVVDITPKEIKDAGFNVVKVILPELHPLFLYEDFPHLYSGRLENHLEGRELNLIPHPFM